MIQMLCILGGEYCHQAYINMNNIYSIYSKFNEFLDFEDRPTTSQSVQ